MKSNAKINNTKINYFLEGARRSRYNAEHWFRYLRKGISEDGTVLKPEEVNMIVSSGQLTMFQIITLKRAMEQGTATNLRVRRLNQRTTTPMVQELLRRHGKNVRNFRYEL